MLLSHASSYSGAFVLTVHFLPQIRTKRRVRQNPKFVATELETVELVKPLPDQDVSFSSMTRHTLRTNFISPHRVSSR